jgi:hypothetical protein
MTSLGFNRFSISAWISFLLEEVDKHLSSVVEVHPLTPVAVTCADLLAIILEDEEARTERRGVMLDISLSIRRLVEIER